MDFNLQNPPATVLFHWYPMVCVACVLSFAQPPGACIDLTHFSSFRPWHGSPESHGCWSGRCVSCTVLFMSSLINQPVSCAPSAASLHAPLPSPPPPPCAWLQLSQAPFLIYRIIVLPLALRLQLHSVFLRRLAIKTRQLNFLCVFWS